MSSLLTIGAGGAAAPSKMVETISKLGRGATNGYGLTETAGGVCSIGGPEYLKRPASCGKPNPIVDVMVVDASGHPLRKGSPGELVVRGAIVFRGYWNKPDATEKAFFRGGWFRTGDLAVQDDEGYVTVLDRIKDLVIRAGENISCAEIEDVAC